MRRLGVGSSWCEVKESWTAILCKLGFQCAYDAKAAMCLGRSLESRWAWRIQRPCTAGTSAH